MTTINRTCRSNKCGQIFTNTEDGDRHLPHCPNR